MSRRGTLRRWLDAGVVRALVTTVVATEICALPLTALGSRIINGEVRTGALIMGGSVALVVSVIVLGLVLSSVRRVVKELEAQADEATTAGRRQQELSAALVQAQSDLGHGAFVANGTTRRFEHVNGAMCRITGFAAEELLALPTAVELAAPEQRERLSAELAERVAGRDDWPERQETVLLARSGELVRVEYAAKRLDAERLVVIFHDITARKRDEEHLRVTDRMASVGRLAAGVAHEINNPLSFVIGNLDVLSHEPLSPEQREVLADAREGAERVRQIVQDLRAFSRSNADELSPVDLASVIDFACTMAQNHIRHRARLEVEHGAVPRVLGVEARLGQVVLNLLVNAADAIPEGHMAENLIRIRTSVAGDEVALEVSDTGTGMSPEVAGRVFDPFFTTKPVGAGTGLGLSISHRIVTDLGGTISVDSTPGRGTTFRVGLRAAEQPESAPPPPAAPAAPASTGGVGRILIIDDEKALANALRRQLRPHAVVSVTDGAEALRLLKEDRGFDLILCDLIMPEMTGMDVARALAAEAPEVLQRMVFMTGGAFTPAAEDFLRRGGHQVVEKPFDMRALHELIAGRVPPPNPVLARSVA
jgi:PAS domain S-box-containing protein